MRWRIICTVWCYSITLSVKRCRTMVISPKKRNKIKGKQSQSRNRRTACAKTTQKNMHGEHIRQNICTGSPPCHFSASSDKQSVAGRLERHDTRRSQRDGEHRADNAASAHLHRGRAALRRGRAIAASILRHRAAGHRTTRGRSACGRGRRRRGRFGQAGDRRPGTACSVMRTVELDATGRGGMGLPLVVVLGLYARNATWPEEVNWTRAEVDA
jgi:hypothetical protein